MAYTHCVVVIVRHDPDATTPSRTFTFVDAAVHSFVYMRTVLLAGGVPRDEFEKWLVDCYASKTDPERLTMLIIFDARISPTEARWVAKYMDIYKFVHDDEEELCDARWKVRLMQELAEG